MPLLIELAAEQITFSGYKRAQRHVLYLSVSYNTCQSEKGNSKSL